MPPVIGKLKRDPQQLEALEMSRHLLALGEVLCHITQETLERTLIPFCHWVHPYQPGDEVLIKDRKKEPLQPVWTDPHTVILATPTALKVTDVTPWIHHTRVKTAATSCDDTWKAIQDPQNLLKVWLQRQRPSLTKDAETCSSYSEAD